MAKEIKIEFLSNDFVRNSITANKLDINSNLEDIWIEFTPNSIGSYKKFFAKIKTNDNQFYVILDNVLITYIDNNIKIQYNGKLRTYDSINESDAKIKEHEIKLKNYQNQIKLIELENNLSINKTNNIDIKVLNEKTFKHEAIVNFLLKENKIKWN